MTRYWIITIPLVTLAVVASFVWLDRPLALWVSHYFHGGHGGWLSFQHAVFATQLAYCAMLPVFIVYYSLRQRVARSCALQCIQLLCLTVPVSFFVKSCLQFLFGRYVPRYRDSNILLFVRNHNLYGFHWLQAGSFPSGHMTMIAAGTTAIALFYRRFWWVAIGFTVIMALLLIGTNYHFLSDVIAGTYLGVTLTLLLYYMRQNSH